MFVSSRQTCLWTATMAAWPRGISCSMELVTKKQSGFSSPEIDQSCFKALKHAALSSRLADRQFSRNQNTDCSCSFTHHLKCHADLPAASSSHERQRPTVSSRGYVLPGTVSGCACSPWYHGASGTFHVIFAAIIYRLYIYIWYHERKHTVGTSRSLTRRARRVRVHDLLARRHHDTCF